MREVLELLVAGDVPAYWRLLERTLPSDEWQEAWLSAEVCDTWPGEWRLSMVADFLRGFVLGEAPSSTVVGNLAWFLDLVAADLELRAA